jgi:hypothetical protein
MEKEKDECDIPDDPPVANGIDGVLEEQNPEPAPIEPQNPDPAVFVNLSTNHILENRTETLSGTGLKVKFGLHL